MVKYFLLIIPIAISLIFIAFVPQFYDNGETLVKLFYNDPVYLAFVDKYPQVKEDIRIHNNFEGKLLLSTYNQTNYNEMFLELHKYNDNPDVQTFLHCRVVHSEDSSFDIHTYAEGNNSIQFIEKEDCLNKLPENNN